MDVISRAFRSDNLGPFLAHACRATGMDRALPMNTGAEAVETALKAARKWGHTVKGIPDGTAEIIVCEGNFHGRTIAITGMSTVESYRAGFGPFPPGFSAIPFGDAGALEAAITPATAAFLVEPIQGEGGVVVPPDGYLAACAEICRRNNVLLLVDEVQTGLGRTGRMLASAHDGVTPDGLMLGKALGGGLMPISLFLASDAVMAVFTPGDHGSTFGGNPIAAAVGKAALEVIEDEGLIARAAALEPHLLGRLLALNSPAIVEVRGRGLLWAVELAGAEMAKATVAALLQRGVLALAGGPEGRVLQICPPLTITRRQLDTALDLLGKTLGEIAGGDGGGSCS